MDEARHLALDRMLQPPELDGSGWYGSARVIDTITGETIGRASWHYFNGETRLEVPGDLPVGAVVRFDSVPFVPDGFEFSVTCRDAASIMFRRGD